MELYYQQTLTPRWSVGGSYALALVDETLSRIDNINAEDQLAFDPSHPNPQDQRHAINVDATYRVSDKWTANLSFAFHSGWPATIEQMVPVTREDGMPDFAVRPEKLWGNRLPAYHRADVRLTRRWATSRGEFRFFGEVSNLINHSNVSGYDTFTLLGADGQTRLVTENEVWFPILPAFGISWTGAR